MEKLNYFKQYELKCKQGKYGQLKKALSSMNSIYSQKDERGWEQYLIFNKNPAHVNYPRPKGRGV